MKTKTTPSRVVLFIALLLLAVVMIIPFVWMLSASFKYNTEIFSYPIKWIPEVFRWDNYQYVWTEITFPTYFFNSLKLSVVVTVGQIIFCSLAAYSFSKLHYPGRDKLFLYHLNKTG
ncbi:MAG: carbohydrate ABC transporter permease [Anaerolineaceae bacterium]|nr:carbohydrate ABC transporter permease [Anaerolineaceae bacterium]